MSPTLPSLQLPLAASTGRGTPPPMPDTDRAERHAIWDTVFERARAVDLSQVSHHPASSAERPPPWPRRADPAPHDEAPAPAFAFHEPVSIDAPWAPAATGAAATGADTAAATSAASERVARSPSTSRDDTTVGSTPRPAAGSPLTSAASAPWPLRQPVEGLSGAIPSENRATTRAMALQASDEPPRPSPDRVTVFVQGKSVAIVVRDLAISEQEALRCGLEATRRLAGRACALRQLTLNGRTVYRQPDPGIVRPEALPSVLAFAC